MPLPTEEIVKTSLWLAKQRKAWNEALNTLSKFLRESEHKKRIKELKDQRPGFIFWIRGPAGKYMRKEKPLIGFGREKTGIIGELRTAIHECMHHVLNEYDLITRKLDSKGLAGKHLHFYLFTIMLTEALPEAVAAKLSGEDVLRIKLMTKFLLEAYFRRYQKRMEEKGIKFERERIMELVKLVKEVVEREEVLEELVGVIDKKEMKKDLEVLFPDVIITVSRALQTADLIGELLALSFSREELLELISKNPIEAAEFILEKKGRIKKTIRGLKFPWFVKEALFRVLNGYEKNAKKILKKKKFYSKLMKELLLKKS